MSAAEVTDRERLAAEHALRLLEGEELMQARGLMASDPAFAAEVAEWEERLSHLQAETAPIAPSAKLWSRIETEITDSDADSSVVALKRQVRNWQVASLMSAAAAIVLALFAVPAMLAAPEQPDQTPAPLMANIPIGDTPLRLAVTYLPQRSEMLVSASGLTADGVHDHELWLVLPEGAHSLGVVVPGEERRISVSADLAEQIAAGSDLILTREPLGGAADGTAGPVVAEGELFTT